MFTALGCYHVHLSAEAVGLQLLVSLVPPLLLKLSTQAAPM
jgi:hypothetical protein